MERKYNFINDNYKIDFELPMSLKELVDMAEKADADNDLGNYIVYADGIDVAAKHFYSVGRITKKNWDTLLYRYEE